MTIETKAAAGDAAAETMETLLAEAEREFEEGEIVRGVIVHVGASDVVVDIGFKSEGVLPIREFQDPRGELRVKVGDLVDVFIEKCENNEGSVVLSREKAERRMRWLEAIKAFEKDEIVEGRIVDKIKGGLLVDIGVKAFLPASQVALRPTQNLDPFLGQTHKFKIIKINPKRGNIVLSRKQLLETERDKQRQETLQQLEVGQVRDGVVKNITSYGAFIDLGGVDGLLHITDMSWRRIAHPSEVVSVGEKVEVKILAHDRANNRISLGLKQMSSDPWATVDTRVPAGTRVKGKVVSLTDYGAFVEISEGVEGLVHVSEMSWTKRVKHPSEVLAVGDPIEAVVLSVDKPSKKISLGVRQTQPDPWNSIAERFTVGATMPGIVRNITDYGAFVQLEEGFDGLLHVSDMSWGGAAKHPSEVLKKGQEVQVKILSVDPASHRISLGLKQLLDDPWANARERYAEGAKILGRITRHAPTGVFVEIEPELEGLIHASELDRAPVSNPEEQFRVGDVIECAVLSVSPDERTITLSRKAVLEGAGA